MRLAVKTAVKRFKIEDLILLAKTPLSDQHGRHDFNRCSQRLRHRHSRQLKSLPHFQW